MNTISHTAVTKLQALYAGMPQQAALPGIQKPHKARKLPKGSITFGRYQRCVSGHMFDTEDNDKYGYYDLCNVPKYEGKLICGECKSDDSSDTIPVNYISGGTRYRLEVGSYIIESWDGEDQSTLPVAFEYARSLDWHSTDPWRGYYQGKAPEGWDVVTDTWFGSMDGYNLDADEEIFRERWNHASKHDDWTDDLELIVAFPRTSNVFSCGLEIYIPATEEAKIAFMKWLGGEGK